MFDFLKIVKTPKLAKKVFPKALWKIRPIGKKIFLTFDDGPIPVVTPAVLAILKEYNAKATFFCIGKNIEENPTIFQQVLAEGHSIGNHTSIHCNGWKTNNKAYFEAVEQCANSIDARTTDHRFLFRPPYGKLTFAQYNTIAQKYTIVMWDVLSFDFDLSVDKETVLNNVLKHTRNGSIIVFHDSEKAKEKVLYALPKVLAHFTELGFTFEKI